VALRNPTFAIATIDPLTAGFASAANVSFIPASPRDTLWLVQVTDLFFGDVGTDYSVAALSEPVSSCATGERPGDDDAALAPCLGDAAADCASTLPSPLVAPSLASCASDPSQDGCGTHCGVDVDLVRLGLASGRHLHATLGTSDTVNPVTLTLEAVTASGLVFVAGDVNGVLDLDIPGAPLVTGEVVLAIRGGYADSGAWALSAALP
jgi:hypothetical protein